LVQPEPLANVRLGSIASFWLCAEHFRLSPDNGHCQKLSACLKSANNGSRLFYHLVATGEILWRRWSFGQPGLPQSFLVSREVFGTPIRTLHVLESENT
jgi:hypothetical protein